MTCIEAELCCLASLTEKNIKRTTGICRTWAIMIPAKVMREEDVAGAEMCFDIYLISA